MTTDKLKTYQDQITTMVRNAIITKDQIVPFLRYVNDNDLDMNDFTDATIATKSLESIDPSVQKSVVYVKDNITIHRLHDIASIAHYLPTIMPNLFDMRYPFIIDDSKGGSILVEFKTGFTYQVSNPKFGSPICGNRGFHKPKNILEIFQYVYPNITNSIGLTIDEQIDIVASRLSFVSLFPNVLDHMTNLLKANPKTIALFNNPSDDIIEDIAKNHPKALINCKYINEKAAHILVEWILQTPDEMIDYHPAYHDASAILTYICGIKDLLLERFDDMKTMIVNNPNMIFAIYQNYDNMDEKNLTELEKLAVRENSELIRYVRHQSDELKLASIEKDYAALTSFERINKSFIKKAKGNHPNIEEEIAKIR